MSCSPAEPQPAITEEVIGSVILCSRSIYENARKLVSNQLTNLGIANISVTLAARSTPPRGHSNLVLLVIDLGTSLRLHDEYCTGGEKELVEMCKKLAENGEFAVAVFVGKYESYDKAFGYRYFDVDSRKEKFSTDQILEIKNLITSLKHRIETHKISNEKLHKQNIQIDCSSIPSHMKPTVLRTQENEYLLFWVTSQANVISVTPTTVTIASAYNGLILESIGSELDSFVDLIRTWNNVACQQTHQIVLTSKARLQVKMVRLGDRVGVTIRSVESER
jgi:hypothetical protein